MMNITNPKLASLLAKKKMDSRENRRPDLKPQPKKPRFYNALDIEKIMSLIVGDKEITRGKREEDHFLPIGKTAEVLRGTYETTPVLQFYAEWLPNSEQTHFLTPSINGVKEKRYEAHGTFTGVVDPSGQEYRLIVYNQLYLRDRSKWMPDFDSFSEYSVRTCWRNPITKRVYRIPSLETNYRLMNTYGFGDDETRSTMKSILDSTVNPSDDLEVMLVSSIVRYANNPFSLAEKHFLNMLAFVKEDTGSGGVLETYKDDIEFVLSKIKSRK